MDGFRGGQRARRRRVPKGREFIYFPRRRGRCPLYRKRASVHDARHRDHFVPGGFVPLVVNQEFAR